MVDGRNALVTIGADPGCDVVLADPARRVSGRHAVLVRFAANTDAAMVRDLGSSNQTYVGAERAIAQPVQQHCFEGTARIFIGPFRLDVRLAAESDPGSRLVLCDDRSIAAVADRSLTAAATPRIAGLLPKALKSLRARDPKRSALIDAMADLVRRGAGRTSALDALVRGLPRAVGASRCLLRLASDSRRLVFPPDALALKAPKEAARLIDKGRCFIGRQELIVPIFDAASPAVVVGDCTLVRAGHALHAARAAYAKRDAEFVSALVHWVIDSALPAAPTIARITAARSWPMALVGVSDAHAALVAQVDRLAESPGQPVLVAGPSGSGKSLLARTLHERSRPHRGRLVVIDCGNPDPVALAVEMFGSDVPANNGGAALPPEAGETVLLENIESLDARLQRRLRTAIADSLKAASPGAGRGSDDRRGIGRIVATTSTDLAAEAAAGRFDRELLNRFRYSTVNVPALRERPDDIVVIALAYLDNLCAGISEGAEAAKLSPQARRLLPRHPDVRSVTDLEDLLREGLTRALARAGTAAIAAAACAGGVAGVLPRGRVGIVVEEDDLGPQPVLHAQDADPQGPAGGQTLQEQRRDLYLHAVRRCGGNVPAAARQLGVRPEAVYRTLDNWCFPRRYGATPAGRADVHLDRMVREALGLAAQGAADGPRWGAEPRHLEAHYVRTLARLRELGIRGQPDTRRLTETMDRLGIPRHFPRTTERVAVERRRRRLDGSGA